MKQRLYLPGLNGVRFLAALLVILDHTEDLKERFGFRPLWSKALGAHLGSIGVTIFFVLSGYLITSLLLAEKAFTGSIGIRDFYVRRALRIWPLYYLITLLGFFVLPHVVALEIPDYVTDPPTGLGIPFLLFTFFLPNVAFVAFPTVPYANILWSVGVEEQFYLIWPWLVRHVRRAVAVGLAAFMTAKLVALLLPADMPARLLGRTRFSCMLIGAAAAYLVSGRRWLVERYVFPRLVQVMSWGAFGALLLARVQLPVALDPFFDEIVAVLVAVLLVNLSRNPRPLISLETPTLDYLGRISYGLYVYHLLAVTVVLVLAGRWYPGPGVGYAVWSGSVIAAVVAATVLLAHVSYRWFESPFLRAKKGFSTVLSGDLARESAKDEPPRETGPLLSAEELKAV